MRAAVEGAPVPAVFERWLKALTGQTTPPERRATCGDCVMCSPDDWTATEPHIAFRPDTRCCTFTPELLNWQVGAMLCEGAEALDSVRVRMAGEQCFPLGLVADRAAYDEAVEQGAFGRDPTLRCPHHLDDGRCGVWQHRNSVCSTWHCRHERHMVGQGTWIALRDLFGGIEKVLALWALEAVSPDGNPLAWDRGADLAAREAFYVACWQAVKDLTPDDVVSRAPQPFWEALVTARRALKAHANAAPPANPVFHGGDVLGVEDDGKTVRVSGYLDLDPVVLDAALWAALPLLDGRPLAEAIARLRGRGLEVSEADLRRLVDVDVVREG